MLGSAATLGVFSLAFWFLYNELQHLEFGAIVAQIRAISASREALAAVLAVGSYFVLSTYDVLALRYMKRPLSPGRTALTAFTASAIGHNVGFAAVASGTVRYRMYSALGLSAVEIATIAVFGTLTFALGTSFLLGASMLFMAQSEPALFQLPVALLHGAGAVLILLPVAYVVAAYFRISTLRIGNWRITWPDGRIAALQLVLSVTELFLAAGVLYALVAPDVQLGYVAFLGIYLMAVAAGLLSSVPAGIGVFEAVLLLALPDASRAVLLGSILVYRIIYYLGPFGLALMILATNELRLRRDQLHKATGVAGDWLSRISPLALSITVMLAGIVLLVSGSSPGIEQRLAFVGNLLPLPLLELSHLLGSAFGMGLLIIARGLQRRLHGAYQLAMVLLVSGIVVSLLKGLDYEEAALLAVALALLRGSKRAFYRQGSLLQQRFSPSWITMILLVILGSVWVGLFSHRHVEYSDELWWQFSLNADAPRMLRASLLAVIVAVGFALSRLIRPIAPPRGDVPENEYSVIRRIVAGSTDPLANAALMGDKRFFFNDAHSAFIMYQVSGRSWIALGDPVGPASEAEALLWRFRELCDRYDGRPAFYQIADGNLTNYLDMGLTLSKLGEEARVSLRDFSLQGARRATVRQMRNRGTRSGARFEVVHSGDVPQLLPELERVSDAWLSVKSAGEKGFSLGSFSRDYLVNFDTAVVRVDDAVVAFANIWQATAGSELSVDLMRHSDSAPKGVMDYLFVELMLWGQARGFDWFNLGMAPLSGLEQHALAPVWHKLGNLIYHHGESFYNFEGLRFYKQKFEPEWRPRYLACSDARGLPRVILDTAVLISGGVRRALAK